MRLASDTGPTCVPASPLPMQFPANGLEKAVEDGLTSWAPATQVEVQNELPGFDMAQPW